MVEVVAPVAEEAEIVLFLVQVFKVREIVEVKVLHTLAAVLVLDQQAVAVAPAVLVEHLTQDLDWQLLLAEL
jgi:hypothetical protein